MKPEIAELWATALESGEYCQGTGQLIQNLSQHLAPKYCCLGVLCALANKAGVISRPNDNNVHGWALSTNGATLPEVVIEWAGMASAGGEYGIKPENDILIARNDNGDSFAEIAAIIREHVEEL